MHELLKNITNMQGASADISKLDELADVLKNTSLCGLGQSAPTPVLSTLRYFGGEYRAHVDGRSCTAGVCGNHEVKP